MSPADGSDPPPDADVLAPAVDDALDAAAAAIAQGAAVVYPTETVYGLGADATDADAVRQVFEIKGRPRSKPLSVGFADREMLATTLTLTDHETAFCDRFLPGPVTLLIDRDGAFPDILVGGGDTACRPDHRHQRE